MEGSEAADQMVRTGIQLTDTSIRLLASGGKNLLALLLALARDNKKLMGKTNMNRLLREQRPMTLFRIKEEDYPQFQKRAKQYGILFSAVRSKVDSDGLLTVMIENGGAREDDSEYKSALDLLFEALEEEEPDHVAVREYKIFKQAPGKTAESILISAAVRLSAFILPAIRGITQHDDLELGMLGERKQAVFCVIPDNDGTFNYLVGMLYTCAFQELYYKADKNHGGALPVPVRLMMDEFCNVALPDDFGKLQATMRSRNIMSTIVLQNISALKALFKDDWEGLIGNADSFLYLGGNEKSTHKYISELLGKETIDIRTSGQTRGSHGSSSVNYQQAGRELLTSDEVRTLDNDLAILFVRGERPVIDQKYDILKHPNLKLTEDGGAAPYVHHPGRSYTVPDLDFAFTTLDEIEIIESE